MKPSVLKPFLSTAIANQMPILLVGAAGIGKTDLIQSACAAADYDVVLMHPAVSDPTDYKGMPVAHDGDADFVPLGDLKKLVNADRPTVAFCDDVGQAPYSVQAALMQLFLARRVGEHKVSDFVTFVAATNRREDRAGVNGLLEPVKSRFASILQLDVDLDDWCDWAMKAGLPVELVYFIRYRPNLLHDPAPSPDMKNSPSPRTVANVGKWMNLGITDLEVLSGTAGEGFATELVAFLKVFRELPNPDSIILSPETAEVPSGTAVLYALCGALSSRAKPEVADNLFAYVGRLPQEFQAFLVKDMITMNPEMAATNAFIRWSSANHEANFGR